MFLQHYTLHSANLVFTSIYLQIHLFTYNLNPLATACVLQFCFGTHVFYIIITSSLKVNRVLDDHDACQQSEADALDWDKENY